LVDDAEHFLTARRFRGLLFVGGVVEVGGTLPGEVVMMSPDAFCAFYRTHLPEVYGYLLRLCAGDRAHAEDLTQDVWVTLVEELRRGHAERADVRWLITVARSRFIDVVRRERRGWSKLALIQRDDGADGEPAGTDVLDSLAALQPLYRAVLVLRYVDGLAVPEVAATVGRGVTETNSLLARARDELRRTELRRAAGGDPR
jgi:RNA polymerase sigma-70 factor (ECF subfamily)